VSSNLKEKEANAKQARIKPLLLKRSKKPKTSKNMVRGWDLNLNLLVKFQVILESISLATSFLYRSS